MRRRATAAIVENRLSPEIGILHSISRPLDDVVEDVHLPVRHSPFRRRPTDVACRHHVDRIRVCDGSPGVAASLRR